MNRPGEEVLRSSTLREMQRVQRVDPDWGTHWGLGFVVSPNNGETMVGHGGSCPGFRTQFSLLPKKKLVGIGMVNAMGVDPGSFVQELFKLPGPEIEKAQKGAAAETKDLDLEKYAGLYRSSWGESAIVPREDGLAMMPLPTGSPVATLSRLKHVSGTVFRLVRIDSDVLGEEFIFEIGSDGRVTRYSQHGNFSEKVQ